MSLLSIENAVKGFNERVLLRGVSLGVGEGERIGLLGPNGCGKSTLMRILAGLEPLDEGTRVVRRDLRLGYLEQNPILEPEQTPREIVRSGMEGRTQVLSELEGVHEALASAEGEELERLLARQSRLDSELDELGGQSIEHRVESTLHSLGLDSIDVPCQRLSGGERRRVALARLLLSNPELLLLDEPTNHLDAFVTDWLEDWFIETRTPLVLVTHDRYFLDRVVDRIVELDRGKFFAYEGGYGDYLEQRSARLDSERKSEGTRQLLLRRETAWMRRGPPARTTKAKGRIRRYHELVDDAPLSGPDELELVIPPGPRLGDRVIGLHGITKSYDGRVIVPPLDLELAAGERLGVVGPNGAGKSTLLAMLLGELEPDAGRREVGETVRFMGIDQMRRDLDPTKTVIEEVAGRNAIVRTGDRDVRVESFLDKFGFPPAMQSSLIKQLSGGEKSRVLLAKLVCAGGNVVVLDEPTNDLDLATLRALEEALLAFPGSAVVVSHDRWFLDRVATQILYLDGQGGSRLHHGDLSALMVVLAKEREAAREAQRAASRPAPKSAPAKTKARRITPWQERELGEIEAAITKHEGEQAALDARLEDPELYRGPREVLEEITSARKVLLEQLEGLYARWEELEALRSAES